MVFAESACVSSAAHQTAMKGLKSRSPFEENSDWWQSGKKCQEFGKIRRNLQLFYANSWPLAALRNKRGRQPWESIGPRMSMLVHCAYTLPTLAGSGKAELHDVLATVFISGWMYAGETTIPWTHRQRYQKRPHETTLLLRRCCRRENPLQDRRSV